MYHRKLLVSCAAFIAYETVGLLCRFNYDTIFRLPSQLRRRTQPTS